MKTLIVTGGSIDDRFAMQQIAKEQYEQIIAADSGIDFMQRNGITPQYIIGDFDSADAKSLSLYEEENKAKIIRLKPEKDDTDTEAAINIAIELGATSIAIIGATGTRLDHVLANVSLLGIGLKRGIPIELLDEHNRVRMTDKRLTIRKDEQYGRYVSIIPYGGAAEKVNLTGFKYPLTDATLPLYSSLGISNEIKEEEAVIEFENSIIIVIESRD
jgi:thiamine pyrophosphokinase